VTGPRAAVLFLVLLAGRAGADVPTGQTPTVAHGREAFTRACAPCHGRGPGTDGATMLPGTAALAAKYQGAVPAALEDRLGLTPEFLRTFIRNGAGAMPMFRATEVSNEDIEAIAAYLTQVSRPD